MLPLAPPLKAHLETVWEPGPNDEPVHPRACRIVETQAGRVGALSRQFGELLAKAGLRPFSRHDVSLGKGRSGPRTMHGLSLHSLRRTATTWLHEAGVAQQVAQAFIGYDSETMNQIYVSIGSQALEKAAAAFPDLL